MKRFLALVLAACMLMCALPTAGFAQDELSGMPQIILNPGEQPGDEPVENPAEESVGEPADAPVEDPGGGTYWRSR